eukprot:gene10481-5252_t
MPDRDLATAIPAFHAALKEKGLRLAYFHADMPFEFSTGEATADKGTNGWHKLAELQTV